MADIERSRKHLDTARTIEGVLDRRLWVLAIVTECLVDQGLTPVLVGGGAVEFYTLGGYATVDLDVIVEPSSAVAETMMGLGFTKEGRIWVRDDLDIALEMPTGPLAGDPDRTIRVDTGNRFVYVIGIEDLVIDRLQALVHWESTEDGRWAARLLAAQHDSIDWDYLKERANEAGLGPALAEVLQSIEDGAE